MVKKYLAKPIEKQCVDCVYCDRAKFRAGKWFCNNPDVHVGVPVDHDLPCFLRRGSKQKMSDTPTDQS